VRNWASEQVEQHTYCNPREDQDHIGDALLACLIMAASLP